MINAGGSATNIFLGFLENCQNNYVKEQLYFHAMGTVEETDGLLKNLLRSALSLVTHHNCKFKTLVPPEVFDLVFGY